MAEERLFRPAIGPLVPYEPGKPVEEVQRELGLERVAKLASNEGQFGPFPEALDAIAGGADAVVMYLSLAVLDPGDEVVCGWPSFPSYVLDAIKLGAEPKRVPLTGHRYDIERILDEIGPRTKIVYLC